MSAGIPMGFVLVVGFSVALLAGLQVLLVAYTVDAARSARRLVELEEERQQAFRAMLAVPSLAPFERPDEQDAAA